MNVHQVCCTSLRDSIDEDSKQRNSKEYVETNSKSKEKTFSIMEPMFLLLLCKFDPREVGLKLGELALVI